ncbi:hypothetical protein BDP27DRAFT_1417166 [Rhodocollybia butyracea]|uniref:G domain-containing protein n=1 Tax=Rhodocollybia butyracea TaxID=206335 RepID=A0A9P5PVQ5_9AGAR|nr:hypothetical protein BDP27DRAFT_1417166 [Rhodocollybia butyracea]
MRPSSESSLHSPVPSSTSTLRDRGSSIIEQELASSTEEILGSCDRFRILVVGKSGAGKSSLINATFSIHTANVSHEMSGISNIYQEITSEQNTRFILHDSQGFAAGETQNYTTVEKFIAEKAKEPKLKDRLHAIWFCMEVPTENGALFEKADDAFLRLDLQSIPVVVIFTKYDLLVRKFEKEASDSIGEQERETMANQKADEFYDKNCVRPLKNITRNRQVPISYVRVSTKKEVCYADTLVKLVEETQSRLDERMLILWALAQRVSVDAKIDACIDVGKRKYWRGLFSSLHFPGKTMEQCLDRIHDDMIDIWNFNDPLLNLKSRKFKNTMARLVEDLDDRNSTGATQMLSFSGAYGAITTILPIVPHVALGAAAGIAVAQWLLHIYQETPSILRLLMGYICDLTNVLQCIFWIMQGRGNGIEVNWALIDLAMDEHENTHARSLIHAEIRDFVTRRSIVIQATRRDEAMEKLSNILQNVRFRPENLSQSPRIYMSLLESKVFSFDKFSFDSTL